MQLYQTVIELKLNALITSEIKDDDKKWSVLVVYVGKYPINFWYLKLKGIDRKQDPTDVDVDRELIFLFNQAQGCKSIKIKIKFNQY